MTKKTITDIIAALLILLFVYAAISKLLDYDTFKVQLGKSPLLTLFAGTAAIGVIYGELFIALLLGIRGTRLIGLYASLFLMVLFTAYLIALLNFSHYIPCSCGGILQNMSWQAHIVFNCVFIVLSIAGIILEARAREKKMLSVTT